MKCKMFQVSDINDSFSLPSDQYHTQHLPRRHHGNSRVHVFHAWHQSHWFRCHRDLHGSYFHNPKLPFIFMERFTYDMLFLISVCVMLPAE